MKRRLIKYLWCPICHVALDLADEEMDEEVISGRLVCQKCQSEYPIIRGIPRFVETEGYAKSFGYEWNRLNWLRVEDEQEFFAITDLSKDDLRSKAVLDVGCGGGRFARFVSRYCSEFVGFDYSDAVDKAHELCKGNPNTHFVQCDVNCHPFKPCMFDIVYNHGVLHHTPDTKKSFDNLPSLVKSGGILYVAVFGECAIPFRWVDDSLRAVLNKLDFKTLQKVCRGFTNIGYAIYRLTRKLWWFSLPKSKDVMVYVLFDWYSPKYHHRHSIKEVKGWFYDAGLVDVKYINAYPYSSQRQKYSEPTFGQKCHLWGTFVGVRGAKPSK